MSKKRKREPELAVLALAGVYEKLADESEEQRLQAAQMLLRDFEPKFTSIEQIKVIIKRLFRGLCSSRKAARLGFSVALTEYLIELAVQRGSSVESGVPASHVLNILDNETTPDGNNSGQDERDHYFGRLFGAEAIIKSSILVKQHDLLQWKRLLDLICSIANKKPWLRQECGWILYCCVKSFASSEIGVPDDFVLDIVEKLTAHKLIRTPEGLAIWLEVSEAFPDVKLPKDVWKHRDPLSKKDIALLADVLKDTKTRENSDDDEHGSQGRAIWSAQLHFAWDVVLQRVYCIADPAHVDISRTRAGSHKKQDHKIVDPATFWTHTIDESLFAPTSSPERKHWGLLLLGKVLTEAPAPMLSIVFSKNAVSCLINSLKGEDRYLQRTARRVTQNLQKRAETEKSVAGILLEALLLGTTFSEFDSLTKTKTIEKMLTSSGSEAQVKMIDVLAKYFDRPETDQPKDAAARRRYIIFLQGKLLARELCRPENADPSNYEQSGPWMETGVTVLTSWMCAAYFTQAATKPPLLAETRQLAKGRLSSHLEQALKSGAFGRRIVLNTIASIRENEQVNGPAITEPDPAINAIINQGWDRLNELQLDAMATGVSDRARTFTNSLALLYCLVLFQIYNGEAEAAEILEELLMYQDGLGVKSDPSKLEDQSDALVEILLSFASKPSKFLRRITNTVFEGIAPQVTSIGLQSLVRILATKESVAGQQEMFDAADEDMDTQDEGTEDSDVDMIDSDVEEISVSSDSLPSDENEEEYSDEDDGEGDSEDDSEDEELAAFDAKLAAALGTRKLTNGGEASDDSSTSGASDTDMDDDQMMTLDSKLAEVFRARQQEMSKKRETKDAKENIVNFKNRVLDLIDVYLKTEHLASQSLELLLPLLHLARRTKTKQLADRACTLVNEFCKRCKGVHVPACADRRAGIDLLLALHGEAGAGASNAHAHAASHGSILVVKSLVNSGVKISDVVDVYAATQKRMLTDKKCRIQAGLFTDWNNWCVSARERFAE